MLNARLIDLGDMASARPTWTQLALQTGNPFATWEWASVWLRNQAGKVRLHLLAVEAVDGQTIGVLPLYEHRRGPFRIVRFIGHGPADRLGPLCEPDARDSVAAALQKWLDSRPSSTVLLGDYLLGNAGWGERLEATILTRSSSPVVEFPAGGWDGYLASRSRNFRSQVRGRRRRLEERYSAEFRLVSRPEELESSFAELIRLHCARWSDEGSGALAGRKGDFHREFAGVALEQGWLRLWTLHLDGQTVAAWYGLRYGGRDWYYQSGRDPAYDRDSVGFTLLAHTVMDAVDHGQTAYELLRGDEPYKARFATSDPGLETISLAKGVLGLAARRALSTLASSQKARRALSRL